jgi:DNA repair exonuclease SbcCD ATPase subunit
VAKCKERINHQPVNAKVRLVELERKLAAERRRREELENQSEDARRWAQAWKRAAKSGLEVLSVIRNLRKLRLAAGVDAFGYHTRDHYELLDKQLTDALREIKFLEKERDRWMENAHYFRSINDRMRMRIANLETILEKQNGRPALGDAQNISDTD